MELLLYLIMIYIVLAVLVIIGLFMLTDKNKSIWGVTFTKENEYTDNSIFTSAKTSEGGESPSCNQIFFSDDSPNSASR